MKKEIIEEDVLKVKEILLSAVGTDQYASLIRMGGLTNHSYQVTMHDGTQLAVRIPGYGTEQMIVRSDEKISTTLACSLDIDAELLYFGDDGAKVSRFIPNACTMSAETLREPERIQKVADVLKRLHSCGKDTGVPFEVFAMAASYEKIIFEKQVAMYSDYDQIKEKVMEIKAEIDAALPISNVPCHNDPLCENWVEGDGKMYLIDWEYAGMNDAMWDLAAVSIEAAFDSHCEERLLSAYLGKTPDAMERKHFLANKIYVDYLWTLWAKARVPYDGQPMEDWAMERYMRLKHFIADYAVL